MKETHPKRLSETSILILKAISAAGVIVTLFALPGLAAGLAPFLKSPRKRQVLNVYVSRLEKSGYITTKGRGLNRSLQLTQRGKRLLNEVEMWDLQISRPKQWDGKWRMVMFDFPKRFEKSRQMFRIKILELGFVQYQKSVFIFPYECVDEIDAIANYLYVHPYVRCMRVDQLDDEAMYKKTFKLQD